MFSYNKPRTVEVTSAVAIGPDASEHPVPPEYVASSETMQALRTIEKSVRAGRGHALRLCRAIAERVARSPEPEFAQAQRVELVTVKVDSIVYLSGDRRPLKRKEHMRCPVLQAGAAP
jgi:hypothetical protein